MWCVSNNMFRFIPACIFLLEKVDKGRTKKNMAPNRHRRHPSELRATVRPLPPKRAPNLFSEAIIDAMHHISGDPPYRMRPRRPLHARAPCTTTKTDRAFRRNHAAAGSPGDGYTAVRCRLPGLGNFSAPHCHLLFRARERTLTSHSLQKRKKANLGCTLCYSRGGAIRSVSPTR